MDDDLQFPFDELEISECENENIAEEILDKATVERIKAKVLNKAVMKKTRIFSMRKFVSFAAAVVIISGALIYTNHDRISAEVSSFFRFIPGYGIAENVNESDYTLADQITAKSNGNMLDVTNAFINGNIITVSFTFNYGGSGNPESITQKTNFETTDEINMTQPVIYLTVDGKKYTVNSGLSTYGGKSSENYIYTFKTDRQVTENNKLSLYYLNNIYSSFFNCNFTVKPVKKYDYLNQIGPTQEHNNITLTATSTEKNGKLEVNVYPINKSGYKIISLGKSYAGSKRFSDKDIELKTDLGVKTYTVPDNNLLILNYNLNADSDSILLPYTFDFNVNDGAKKIELNIPYLIVQSFETEDVSIPIPDNGNTEKVNIPIKFKDGTATITSVEGLSDASIAFKVVYTSINKNQQFKRLYFTQDEEQGNDLINYDQSPDKNGYFTSFSAMLSKNHSDTIKLTACDPQYAFTDEYDLALGK